MSTQVALADLTPGDVIARMGGSTYGRDCKRVRFPEPGVEVVDVYRAANARSRATLVVRFPDSTSTTTYLLDFRYPVEIVDAVVSKPAPLPELSDEQRAKIAARRAERKANG